MIALVLFSLKFIHFPNCFCKNRGDEMGERQKENDVYMEKPVVCTY